MSMKDGVNAKNLQKLATFLAYGDLPAEVAFNMNHFSSHDGYGEELTAGNCGAAGCAIGFAPFAGIKKKWGESFFAFSERTLLNPFIHRKSWLWCFDPDWSSCDNTPLGAAKRIQLLLDLGDVPDGFSAMSSSFVQFVPLYKSVVVKGEAA